MPIPFIAGAIIGAVGVTLFSKRNEIKKSISEFDGEEFAKNAGKMTENAILKVQSLNPCKAKEEAKKPSKKATK